MKEPISAKQLIKRTSGSLFKRDVVFLTEKIKTVAMHVAKPRLVQGAETEQSIDRPPLVQNPVRKQHGKASLRLALRHR